ncbi:MAG: Outer membrane efflux protein [Ignavibacteria bacterium]|nr:MAG: Outer membrane efflux protein [Ignavibacteria bacterium]KAF0156130.1 MAG: Outer membrane efflux protein [Ignavibacteria bacterium]
MLIKRNFEILILLIALAATADLHAQQKLSLKEAVRIALENNYDIQMAKSDAEISGNNYSIGNAGFLPNLNVSASQTKTVSNTKQEYSSGQLVDKTSSTSNNTNASAALNWTIFDGLKMFLSFSKLKELKEIGEVKLRSQVESSVADVIKFYYDIVRQKNIYNVSLEGVAISEQRLKITEDKFSVGSASKLEVLSAKVDLNTDRSNLLNQEVVLNGLKVSLNTVLGRKSSEEFDVEEYFEMLTGLEYNKLLEDAYQNNVDVLQSEKNKSVSSYDVGIYRAEYLPRFTLSSGYTYSNAVSDAGFFKSNRTNGYNLGINLSWNLFNGFGTTLLYQNALINLDKNQIKLQQTKALVESNLIIAFKNYEKNTEILSLEAENVSVAKENLDLAIEQIRLGSISPIEFRDVQKNYITAQSRLSTAQFNAKISERDLLKQSGALVK